MQVTGFLSDFIIDMQVVTFKSATQINTKCLYIEKQQADKNTDKQRQIKLI